MLDWSYLGAGYTYFRIAGSSDGFSEFGNVSLLKMALSEDVKKLPDSRRPGGGTRNQVSRLNDGILSMVCHDLSAENLALAQRGGTSTVTGSTITGESVVAKLGKLIRTAQVGISAVTVTDDPNTTTYVEGTDYEVRPAGIVPLAGGSISEDDPLLVSYTYATVDVVEALINSGVELELLFEGLNEARSDKAAIVEVWRFKPGLAKEVSLIGDDYAGLEISGEMLSDDSKTGTNISKYFKESLEV